MWQGGLYNMKLILMSYIVGFALALPSQELPAPRPNCIRMTPEKERQIDIIVEKLGNFLNNLSIEHEHFDIRLIRLSIEQHSEDEVEEKETVLQLSVNDCPLSGDELEEIDHHREMAKQDEKEREPKEAKLKQEQEVEKLTDQKQKSENLKNKQKQEYSRNPYVTGNTKDETLTSNEHSGAYEQNEAKTLKKVHERQEKTEGNSKTEHDIQNTDVKPEAAEKLNNNDEEAKSGKNFEVLYLDLDDNGQELVKAIGRKKKPHVVYVQERNSGQTEFWFLKRR